MTRPRVVLSGSPKNQTDDTRKVQQGCQTWVGKSSEGSASVCTRYDALESPLSVNRRVGGSSPISGRLLIFYEQPHFLRTTATDQLTPGAEIVAAGRFAFIASSGTGLRRFGRSAGDLRFDGEQIGSEWNRQGSFRTPKSRSRNL